VSKKLLENKFAKTFLQWGSLFTSFGTLICCAIPSTLVLLGMGASLATFLGEFPQLIWLSENKEIVFGLSFFMLILGFVAQKWSAQMSCPIDQKENCEATKNWSKPVLYFSLIINIIGAFYAFILPKILF
jgi:hypothetical protein